MSSKSAITANSRNLTHELTNATLTVRRDVTQIAEISFGVPAATSTPERFKDRFMRWEEKNVNVKLGSPGSPSS